LLLPKIVTNYPWFSFFLNDRTKCPTTSIIRNKLVRGSYSNRVASIVDRIRENRLKRFGYIIRIYDLEVQGWLLKLL